MNRFKSSTNQESIDVMRICLFFSIIFISLIFSSSVIASSYNCNELQQCGLKGKNTYPNVVLGAVIDIADNKETAEIYQWARQNGYWQALADDQALFIKKVQLLSIEIPVEQRLETITLLMGREDYERSMVEQGDYIRYTPRDSTFFAEGYSSPEKDAYWKLYGCVAILCRAEDIECSGGYQSGVYSHADGLSLTLDSEEVLPAGSRIDPQTYLPIKK